MSTFIPFLRFVTMVASALHTIVLDAASVVPGILPFGLQFLSTATSFI